MQDKKETKILILNGSPRKQGNTAVLLNWLEAELQKQGYDFLRHDLYFKNIKGCAHCNACKKVMAKPGCVLQDDATQILDDIVRADVIVMASPVYCWSFSGCLSALHDRMYSLFKYEIGGKSLLAGKKIIGMFTSGGEAFEGMQYCVGGLKDMCAFGGAEYFGTVGAPKCETPDKLILRENTHQEIISLVKGFAN